MSSKTLHKITYLIPSLGTGGAEFQSINQINYLCSNESIDVSVIILGSNLENLNLLKIKASRIHQLNQTENAYISNETTWKSFYYSHLIAPIIKSNNTDIILSILPLSHFVARIMLLTNSFKKDVIHIPYYRAVDFNPKKINTITKKLFFGINKILAKKFDNKAIFVSNAVKTNVQSNFFVPVKNKTIYNSLPLKIEDKKLALQYFESKHIRLEEKFIIIIPGRLISSKGHDFFFRAFSMFLSETEEDKTFLVVIAGDGILYQKLKTLAEESVFQGHVHFTRQIKNDLMLSIMSLADLVCIPSINEGFGNVAIEALMLGKTVLSSNAGGLDEIIINKKNGYKFNLLDINDFSTKLNFILNNPDLLKSSSIKQHFNKYSIDTQIETLLSFILK